MANSIVKFFHATTPIVCSSENCSILIGTTAYSTKLFPFEGSSFELRVVSTGGHYGTVSLKNCSPVIVHILRFRLLPGNDEKLNIELKPNESIDIQNIQFCNYLDPATYPQFNQDNRFIKLDLELQLSGKN
jgi:hypothetical protein